MSDIFLDTQYIHKISHKLEKFHKVKKDVWAFRCPICGDSKDKLDVTRGNFQIYKGQVFSGCYRCNESLPFGAFLKKIDHTLYNEYVKESFGAPKKRVTIKEDDDSVFANQKPTFVSHALDFTSDKTYNHLLVDNFVRKVSGLDDNHPAKIYCRERGLEPYLDRLYYTNKFKDYANFCKRGSFESTKYDTPRLVIPFFDKEGKMFAMQGRSFNPKSKAKYITIKIDDEMPKIYGLDTVDESKPILLLEGPLNSLFVNNAIAATGSNLESYMDLFPDAIMVYDNDARNTAIVDKVKKSLQSGHKVVLWNKKFKTGEDINDIVLNHHWSPEKITEYLISNAFSGLMGLSKFNQWRKV